MSNHLMRFKGKFTDDKNLPIPRRKSFEELKQINQYGAEYWSARDLQPLLGYNHWRSFDNAVTKAITSCEKSGNEPGHHFARARKPITGGKGAVQEVDDYHLSRFACYLIAQNGDPRKPEIANAQKCFAIQTRRQACELTLAGLAGGCVLYQICQPQTPKKAPGSIPDNYPTTGRLSLKRNKYTI